MGNGFGNKVYIAREPLKLTAKSGLPPPTRTLLQLMRCLYVSNDKL